jgi:hypothetical protein
MGDGDDPDAPRDGSDDGGADPRGTADGGIDPDRLDRALADAFGGTAGERRAVVRAAGDLADAGRLPEDRGHALTVGTVVDELDEAPGGTPADRWNWWIGALDVAYGGYAGFGVNRYPTDDDGSGGADDPGRSPGGR